jgi:hypothetical protein
LQRILSVDRIEPSREEGMARGKADDVRIATHSALW